MEDNYRANTTLRLTLTIYNMTVTPPAGFKPTNVFWTLFDLDRAEAGVTPAIVNGRNGVDITTLCDANGNLVLDLVLADMALLDATKQSERRGLLVYWTYNSGVDRGEKLITFTIERNQVPAA